MVKPRFIVDAMLGNIARKLRLLGYDSTYYSNIKDSDLISKVKEEKRILITKDEQLAKKTTKLNLRTVLITKNDEIEQFFQINNKIKLTKLRITGATTRCPVCNESLNAVTKEKIAHSIPDKVLEIRKDFWRCDKCNKIYWEGTHIDNLKKITSKMEMKLNSNS